LDFNLTIRSVAVFIARVKFLLEFLLVSVEVHYLFALHFIVFSARCPVEESVRRNVIVKQDAFQHKLKLGIVRTIIKLNFKSLLDERKQILCFISAKVFRF
jgi:hypothetical protein